MEEATSGTRETNYSSNDVVRCFLVSSVSLKLDGEEKRFKLVAGQRKYVDGPLFERSSRNEKGSLSNCSILKACFLLYKCFQYEVC